MNSWHSQRGVLLLKCVEASSQTPPDPSSDQAEAFVLLHSLSEATAQDLFGLVAGHVEKVVAGVGDRQVVLLCGGGLDDNTKALHAVDGDAVAAGQEHCSQETPTGALKPTTMKNVSSFSVYLHVQKKPQVCNATTHIRPKSQRT